MPATQQNPLDQTPPTAWRPGQKLKHGLPALQAVAADEQPEEFETYRDDLLAVLQPVGAVEEDLAEMMLMCGWRLRRLWRFESALHFLWKGRGKNRGDAPFVAVVLAFFSDVREGKMTLRFTQQEAHLMRNYQRAESRLRLRQAERGAGRGAGTAELAPADSHAGAVDLQPAQPPLATSQAAAPSRAGCSQSLHGPEGTATKSGSRRGTGAGGMPEAPTTPGDAPHSGEPQPPLRPTDAAPPEPVQSTGASDCRDTGTGEIQNRRQAPGRPAAPSAAGGGGSMPMAAD